MPHQFKQFLLDIQAEYGDVVYHNDARWLSRGSALQRFYSLKKEIGQFLEKMGQPMPELSVPVWLADFGFLVDITRHLNALNTSLQGQNAVVSQLYSHIIAFGTKLQLFQRPAPITNAAQYHTFPIAAGNNDHFSREQYQCPNEEVCSRHLISG